MANFRNACASVAVVEIDPVTRLEASLDGFAVPGREEALRTADVVITVTGAESVITADDLGLLKDGAVLLNAGHFPREIAVDELASAPPAPGSAASGGSGSVPAPPPAAAGGSGGFADDEGAGQHDAARHPPGPDVRA